jgi:zinc transporter ZupT
MQSLFGQLLTVSGLSLGTSFLVFVALRFSHRKTALYLILFLFGVFLQLFWTHFKSFSGLGDLNLRLGSEGGTTWDFVWFLGGLLLTFLLSRMRLFRRLFEFHKLPCEHHQHEQKTLGRFWMVGMIPHSFADGVFWFLSLGFAPVFAREVFLFLILHRAFEMAAWVALLFGIYTQKWKSLLWVMGSIVSFLLGACFSIWMGSELWAYRPWLVKVLLFTLGYIVALAFLELKRQVQSQLDIRRGKKNFYYGLVGATVAVVAGILTSFLTFSIFA